MYMPPESCIPAKPYLVTIFGAAGSGKSVLALAVAEMLGDGLAARVPADYFFVPREEHEPLECFLQRPLMWDWSLLHERLSLPAGSITTTPDADFGTFARNAETGGRRLPIRPVMIVDAMAPMPCADLVIRLDVPGPVRRERIVDRDLRWGTRVQDRWSHLERTWNAVTPITPDLILDGEREVEHNAGLVAAEILRRTQKNRRDG